MRRGEPVRVFTRHALYFHYGVIVLKRVMLMDKQAQTVLTALTFSCITRELSFFLWGAASPEPPHWSVSLFALQFGWAGLFQFQSLLPYGCGLQSVVVGRCPASCCPVCSSPAGEKEDTVSWRRPTKDVVSLLPRFEACIDWHWKTIQYF